MIVQPHGVWVGGDGGGADADADMDLKLTTMPAPTVHPLAQCSPCARGDTRGVGTDFIARVTHFRIDHRLTVLNEPENCLRRRDSSFPKRCDTRSIRRRLSSMLKRAFEYKSFGSSTSKLQSIL